ncbi:hypothetical protein HYZ82_00830 [Candidatus Nomurabacteria bacterium]|nr:hypothetical protein [Candidatus Nomurabacteria bacterium]
MESIVTVALDNHAKIFLKYVPRFVKDFADAVPEYLYRTLASLGTVKFSKDVNKAHTFRSKIIWEEAVRRGIAMEQVVFMGRPLDYYRALLPQEGRIKYYYFESIPLRPEFLDMSKNWDDKVVMKEEFRKRDIPVPAYAEFSFLSLFGGSRKRIFSELPKPMIVKPRVGSRGRHTITNINTFKQFKEGVGVAGEICAHLIAEEHLKGNVCRATIVDGKLAGFYMGRPPTLLGDGKKTIIELIADMDKKRSSRVEPIRTWEELHAQIGRSGFVVDDILPSGATLPLSHRIGRLFGGTTEEMIDDLHPSFLPIFKKAAKITGLSVVGFDCIIPDPTKDANSQKWGIIECNTLPFIDLHYFALKGKPRNIAGMIWDMWK